MKKLIKNAIVLIMACAMLFSIFALAGCNDDQAESDVSSGITPVDDEEEKETETETDTEPVDLSLYYDQPLLDRLNKSYVIDGQTVTVAEYNFFYMTAYSEYSNYAYYGYYPATYEGHLDLEAPCEFLEDEEGTWGDFLDQQVEREIKKIYMMYSLAQEAGITLTEENVEAIDATISFIENDAQANGVEPERYLAQYYGDEMDFALLTKIMEKNFLSNAYYEYYLANYEFSDEEIMIPSVRHILYPLTAEATDEEIDEARQWAEGIVSEISEYNDMILIGDREMTAGNSSESKEFTMLQGQTVEEFDQWSFDASREEGDIGVVHTRFGFHVIYFIGRVEASDDQKEKIAEGVLAGILDEMVDTDRFALIPA